MLRSVVDPKNPRKFASWVRELNGSSGAYRIVVASKTLYVGSSVNGNLYGTLTRKMQRWARNQSNVSPGHTFDRFGIKAEVEIVDSDMARAVEQVWIEQYRPELNEKAAAQLEESYEPPPRRRSSGSAALDEVDAYLDEFLDDFVPYY